MKIFPSKRYLLSGLLTLVLTVLLSFNFGRTNLPATAQAAFTNLIGTWNYEVSVASQPYQIQISNRNGMLVGRYIVPNNNNSYFYIKVFESLRGRPVLTISQSAFNQSGNHYFAALSGRLDNNSLITGNFVDLDNNRGTFRMTKL